MECIERYTPFFLRPARDPAISDGVLGLPGGVLGLPGRVLGLPGGVDGPQSLAKAKLNLDSIILIFVRAIQSLAG
jgi:hypothetical protein